MKTRHTTKLALLFAACLTSQLVCADEPPAATTGSAGANATAAASVITVAGRPTVKSMSGECHLIREPAPSPALKTGLWLKAGDVLDLGNDCAMTIAVTGHKNVELQRSHGRYYRLESAHPAH